MFVCYITCHFILVLCRLLCALELLTCHFFPCPVVYQQGLGDEVSLRDRHCLYLIVCTFLSFVDRSLRLVNYVCLFIVYLYVCLYVCMSLTGEILKIYLVGAS